MGRSLRFGWVTCLLFAGSIAAACGDDSDDGKSSGDGSAGEAGSSGASSGGTGGKGGSSGASSGRGGSGPADGGDGAMGGAGGEDGGAGGSAGLGLKERLDNLGAKTDLPPTPKDPDGDPVPRGYHPLKKRFATIDPHQEIFFSGPSLNMQREGLLNDGFTGGFGPLLNAQFTPWINATHRTAVAGDVNGDGVQEFVAVYYEPSSRNLMAKVIWGPRGGAAAHDDEPFVLANVPTPTTVWEDWFQHAVAVGNVDGDPAEELWVAYSDLFVFDDLNHDFGPLHREPYGSTYVSVTRGDFDAALADPHDEMFVMYTVFPANEQRYQVFDGLEKSFEAGGRVLRPVLTNPPRWEIALRQGFAVAGEFDGDDPQQEIAFVSGDAYAWRLMLMDDALANYRTFDSMMFDLNGDNVMLAAADIDADGVDEVACDRWIFDELEDLPASNDRTEVPDITQPNTLRRIDTGIFAYQVRGAASVTPDYGVPERRTARQFVALDWGNQRLVHSARNPVDGNRLAWVSLGSFSQARYGDVLAVGNVDDDSAVVEFTGDHELLYPEPELLVAMAPPPFYEGSNQLANTYTSFGKGTATGVERESSVGFSVGFSIGYSSEDPFGISESEFKISVNQEFDSFAKSKATQSEWITYTTGPEDTVLFSVVPFDVYYYQVVSSPNAREVGTTLSVNVPREIQTMLATSEYFDRFVDDARKSAPLFTTHVVGDPWSYPDVDRRNELCAGDCFRSRAAITVGQGNGWTQVDISQAESEGRGTSYKLSTEVTSEASLFGVSFGTSVGFSYGYGIEVSTEETTIFTGRIGSLDDLTPETTYSAGLFAHRQAHPTSIKPILVVDYWVPR
jgi:hypothetical protein